MKILSAPVPVLREGDMQETTFSIKASGKALKILTSNLYSNPVRAVLNETGANAVDSHSQANCPERGFEIHLPSTFSPYYSIRDFGIGMDHKFMMTRYPQAFDSTKDTTNDLIGGFGIGGKLSPLGLSDAYTVACWDGQTRREYSIFFNERGIPTIAMLLEEEDKALRGVEVKVPIAKNLHAQFQQEAANHVYRFYQVKPVVKGCSGWSGFEEVEYKLKADDGMWSFPKHDGVATVSMGVYHFPLDANSINKVTDEQRALIDSGIVLRVPLGDLDTASNRESLYYNDKTNATLKKLLNKAQLEVAAYVQKAFDAAPDMLAAKRLFHDYFKYGGIANKIGRILGDKPCVRYKGITMTDATLELTDGATAVSFQRIYRRGKYVVNKSDFKEDILMDSKSRLFESDGRHTNRIKHRVRESTDNDAYALVLSFKDAAAKTLFYKTNGLESTCEFVKTSTLPKPPRTVSGDKRVNVFTFNEKEAVNGYVYRSNAARFWVDEMIEGEDGDDDISAKIDDIEDEAPVYITIDRFKPAYFDSSVSELALLIARLRKLDPKFPSVYGIRQSDVGKANAAGWIAFKDAARPLFDLYFKDNEGFESIDLSQFNDYISKGITDFIPELSKLEKRSKDISKSNVEFDKMVHAAAMMYGAAYKVPARKKEDLVKDIRAALKDLELKYPLLKKLVGCYQLNKVDIKEYMELVDAALLVTG